MITANCVHYSVALFRARVAMKSQLSVSDWAKLSPWTAVKQQFPKV
jgi:hypothetical protein